MHVFKSNIPKLMVVVLVLGLRLLFVHYTVLDIQQRNRAFWKRPLSMHVCSVDISFHTVCKGLVLMQGVNYSCNIFTTWCVWFFFGHSPQHVTFPITYIITVWDCNVIDKKTTIDFRFYCLPAEKVLTTCWVEVCQVIPLLTLLCTQGHNHTRTGKGFPQTVSTKSEAELSTMSLYVVALTLLLA